MRIVLYIVGLAIVLMAGVHLYFYWAVGTFDPCRAAVLRIVQKERKAGRDLTAGIGVLFGPQFEDTLRGRAHLLPLRAAR